jgi:hypothetical protein
LKQKHENRRHQPVRDFITVLISARTSFLFVWRCISGSLLQFEAGYCIKTNLRKQEREKDPENIFRKSKAASSDCCNLGRNPALMLSNCMKRRALHSHPKAQSLQCFTLTRRHAIISSLQKKTRFSK